MRLLAVLLITSWIAPSLAQNSPAMAAIDPNFSQPLAAAVFTSALSFITPRTLEPVTVPQLTVWGLRGLTALDPSLTPELREDSLRLLAADRLVFNSAIPSDQSAAAWGELAATAAAAAAVQSPLVRRAGTPGVIRNFFDELFNHLDPYSRYEPPGAATTEREHRSGQAGLGLQVAARGGQMLATVVVPDSPADDSGVRAGDRILSIDGHLTRGQPAATVAALIAGTEGTVATLTWRGRDGRQRTEEITRALVAPATVTAERIGGTLMIRIAGFSRNTDEQFADALAAGLGGRTRVTGLVLDLRGNRGGLLRQAVSVVDQVMEDGVVAITAGRNPEASHIWYGGAGQDMAGGRPIVVLVDGRSASAAEIVAAALADSKRGVVVGSSTLGKGLVQTIAPLPDGGELFVTWSRVLAPLGWPIQGLGVLPQVCTSLGRAVVEQQLTDLLAGQQDMATPLLRHRDARAPLPAAQIVEFRHACPASEGRDLDLDAAKFLLDHPAAYTAALIVTKPQAGVQDASRP